MKNDNRLKRMIGLDIFRILSMCGIIGLHVMGNGGILKNTPINSEGYPLLLLLYCLFYLSVNRFALLTGYLSINKKNNKYSRLVELLAIIVFYIIVETAVFYLFNINNVRAGGTMTLAKSLFPFGVGYYWYISCYIFLFFMIPYLNRFVTSISQETYRKLIMTIVALLSIIPTLFLGTDFFKINSGYSPLWLIVCYLIGGYYRLYPSKLKTKQCILRLILSIVAMVTMNYAWRIGATKLFGHAVRDAWIIDYVSPLNLYASIMALIIFSRIKIKEKRYILTVSLSAAAFSVYIFHDQWLFYNYILKDSLSQFGGHNVLIQISVIIGSIAGIYLLAYLMDFIRKAVFWVFRLDKLSGRIGTKMNRVLDINDES